MRISLVLPAGSSYADGSRFSAPLSLSRPLGLSLLGPLISIAIIPELALNSFLRSALNIFLSSGSQCFPEVGSRHVSDVSEVGPLHVYWVGSQHASDVTYCARGCPVNRDVGDIDVSGGVGGKGCSIVEVAGRADLNG